TAGAATPFSGAGGTGAGATGGVGCGSVGGGSTGSIGGYSIIGGGRAAAICASTSSSVGIGGGVAQPIIVTAATALMVQMRGFISRSPRLRSLPHPIPVRWPQPVHRLGQAAATD